MKLVVLLACVLILSGCENERFFSSFAITDNAAGEIIKETQTFGEVDLVALLDPKQFGRVDSFDGLRRLDTAVNASPGSSFFEKVRQDLENDPEAAAGLDRLENAFRGFYDPGYRISTQVRRRNGVQARLIGASDQKCGHFLDQVRKDQAGFNFALGSLTSLLGGVGAIVSGADLARAFSGAAAIASGVRAEGNDANFRQLTAEVLVRGIESRRLEVLEKIETRRSSIIESYTVEDAVADAVKYHSVCNLISGLEHASSQVVLSQDPGLKRTLSLLKKAGVDGPITFDPEKVVSDTRATSGSGGLEAIVSDTTAIRSNATGAIRSIERNLNNAIVLISALEQTVEEKKAEFVESRDAEAELAPIRSGIEALTKTVTLIENAYSKAIALNNGVFRMTAQDRESDATKKVVDLVEIVVDVRRRFDEVSEGVNELYKQLETL